MRQLILIAILGSSVACGASVTELQSRAVHDFGCPASELRVINVSQGVRVVEGCGQKATYVESCNAKNFVGANCLWLLETKKEAAETPNGLMTGGSPEEGNRRDMERNETPLPSAALGYSFDMDTAKARSACEDAGHVWGIEEAHYTCSGTPVDGGFPFKARLGFCANSLCELVLLANLESDFPRFDEKFRVLNTAMTSKYGRRQRVEGRMAGGCESAAVTCAATNHGWQTSLWFWPDGQNVELDLRGGSSQARLAIRYYLLVDGMSLDTPSPVGGHNVLDASVY